MKKFLKFLPSIALSLVLLSLGSFGQTSAGSISGTVKDEKGGVIPGASVTVTGISVGFTRTVQTDSDGVYRVQQVPAGTYKISVGATAGFAATTVDKVTVNVEKNTTADVTAGISANVNTVEVSADPLGVNIDTSDSKVQTNITQQLIDQLPKGGSFTSLLKVSPGTRPEPLSGGFQVDGASGSENSFIVDGQALENFRTGVLNTNNNIPTSLVAEMQIKTGGFEAEHGGASGGVVTVVTKSGSDSWHGEFGTTFEPSKLQPNPRFTTTKFVNTSSCPATTSGHPTTVAECATVFAANPQNIYSLPQNRDSFLNTFPTASLGGPIIKKHLWFYGNYSPQFFDTTRTSNFYNSFTNSSFSSGKLVLTPRLDSSGNPLAPIQYQIKQKNEYAFGRLDASIFSKLRVTGTYLWNPVITDGGTPFATKTTSNPVDVNLAGTLYPSQAYYAMTGGRTNSNNITTQAVYTPTSNLIVTFRYSRAFLNEKNGNYAIPNAVRYRCQGQQSSYSTVTTGCPGGFGYQNLTTNSLTTRDVSLRNEYNADATYLVHNFGGNHEFKGGYQYGTTKNDLLSGNASTGIVSLYYGSTPNQLGTSAIPGFLVAAESGGSAITTCPAINTTTCLGVGTLYRFGASGVASNKYQAIFFQDKWQPSNRLTLNLGVRAENENLPSFNLDKGTPPLKFGWGDKVAPRLGAAYDLFGDGRTKIYGSYGWFYDRLKFELPRGSFGGNFYRIDTFRITSAHPNYDYYTPAVILGSFTDPIGGGNPSTTGGISELQSDFRIPSNLTAAQKQALGLCVSCGVADDIKAFRQSEFTVGVERELSRLFVFSARYTRKNVDHAIEDHAIIGQALGENYYIGNPGEGTDLAADKAAGYVKSAKAQRLYNGLELVLNKRLSNNYFFNLNYTFSRLYGNYSGLASSDEAGSGNGRTSPGVNRFFDYVINGFTATGNPDNGNLPTDRRHAFKAYGGYNFDWWGSKTNSTELSFFQQVLQGTPQTTFITLNSTAIPLSKRGDLGRTPTFWQTDLSLTHRYKFGRDGRFTLVGNLDLLNAFNNNAPLLLDTNKYRTSNTITFNDIDPTFVAATQTPTAILNKVLSGQIGTQIQQLNDGGLPSLGVRPNPISLTYGSPTVYQAPRVVRFGFRLLF